MPHKRHRTPSRLPQLLAIGGFALVVVVLLTFKQKPQAAALPAATAAQPGAQAGAQAALQAEAQLDQALAAGRPVLAFFHSNTCHNCIVMMDTVNQVYPEYQDAVVLVDINVYESQNESLLQRVRLQYIPTLIFYDQNGQSETLVGVMEAAQLSEKLSALAGEP